MKKLLATALAATALIGTVFALGEKKTKQTVITVLDYQDATAPNSFDDNKLIWDAFEAAHPDIKMKRSLQKTLLHSLRRKAFSTTTQKLV